MRKMVIHGREYISLREVARAYGLEYSSLQKRDDSEVAAICHSLPPVTDAQYLAVLSQRVKRFQYEGAVEVAGVEYPSIDAAAAALGIKRISLIRNIKRGSVKFIGRRSETRDIVVPVSNIVSITRLK